MHSSTSSSDHGRVVNDAWGRTLGAAVLLTLLALVPWELHWRSLGAEPSISDLEGSWSVTWDRIETDSIVLIGTSKMQSALDPALLGKSLGTAPAIQLALIDRSPLPVLERLAEDDAFGGLVIVDVASRIFFDGTGGRERATQRLLRAYRRYRSSPGEWIDARLGMAVESRLALRLPGLSLRRLIASWQTGRRLAVPFAKVRPDRFRALDFSQVNLAGRRSTQALIIQTRGRPANAVELRALASRVRSAAHRIRARGGEVVLTLLPVNGRALEAESARYPRTEYWDALVRQSASIGIHFQDHERLAGFECRDGLHLEHWDAMPFTRAFAATLRELLPTRF